MEAAGVVSGAGRVPAETIARRPSVIRTLWRVATSLGKGLGRDPSRALGRGARLDAVLDPDDIARYAAVCGFERDEAVPITFPHMMAFPLHTRIMTRDAFPFSVMGAIHLENAIESHARLRPGDRLALEAQATALFRHPGGQAVEITTEVLRDGAVVWESRSLYLFRGARRPTGSAYASRLRGVASSAGFQERARWSLPASIGRRYARVSGDWNPIHVSSATARLFGLRSPIAHGMWMKARSIAAVAASPLVAPLLASQHRIASVTVAFRTPASLPGVAALFQGQVGGRETHFEVRETTGPRRLLRGCLRLEAGPG